jgi:hypothetical protein
MTHFTDGVDAHASLRRNCASPNAGMTGSAMSVQRRYGDPNCGRNSHPSLLAAAGLAIAASASVANASFVGWVGALSNHGSFVYLDVYAGMSGSNDHLLNVFNMNISSAGATFVQGATPDTSRWAPSYGTSTRDSADSFVTLGMMTDGSQTSASGATSRDPSFTNYLTSGATTIAHNAGWYNTDPLGTDADAVLLLPAVQHANWVGATATYGIWVAHFVFNAAEIAPGASVSFSGTAGYRDAGSRTAQFGQDTRTFALVAPAPGALAALALGGCAARRRRR